ncbi:hypothetical protein SP6_30_00700 [Sphingomonas paucimobilis NBRC 13935]|uniref:DNA, contig: SP630 n=1 Tax=Sphingomonas paucimobilis NBRC 13935 TaxID=1219050 RepID=A0A0C9M2N6_SPHPI|nr:hypothetical protein SP6_30_00700 [Sphingomonas paucimobilis NBRC 13935]
MSRRIGGCSHGTLANPVEYNVTGIADPPSDDFSRSYLQFGSYHDRASRIAGLTVYHVCLIILPRWNPPQNMEYASAL